MVRSRAKRFQVPASVMPVSLHLELERGDGGELLSFSDQRARWQAKDEQLRQFRSAMQGLAAGACSLGDVDLSAGDRAAVEREKLLGRWSPSFQVRVLPRGWLMATERRYRCLAGHVMGMTANGSPYHGGMYRHVCWGCGSHYELSFPDDVGREGEVLRLPEEGKDRPAVATR
jgi:hypothetical protein